jgi:hypothetical protein
MSSIDKHLIIPYFEGLHNCTTEYLLELFYKIETLFDDIDYTSHMDDMNSITTSYPNLTGPEKATIFHSFYREHIDKVLVAQGIFLNDIYSNKLSDLVEILQACNRLGNTPLSELLPLFIFDDSLLSDEIFASVISHISELSEPQVMEMIKLVSETTMEYLHKNIPVPHSFVASESVSKDRFLRYLSKLENTGVTVNIIKAINSFNYEPISTMIIYSLDYLSILDDTNVKSTKLFINEILLFLLGSSIEFDEFKPKGLSIIDELFTDLTIKLKLSGEFNLGLNKMLSGESR